MRVADVKVTNLISWDFGGCLGQSIPLVDDGETKTKNGWSNQDILPYLKKLQIGMMMITEGHSRDYEIEEAIRQKLFEEKNIAKKNQIDSFYNEYIKEANAILAQKDYEKAKAKFKQASDLKRNEPYPISKIAAIDKILDEQKNEIKFNNLVADGDRFTASDKKTEARTAYREALKINPNNTIVQSKLDALGKDELSDLLEEIKKMTNGFQYIEPAFEKRTQYFDNTWGINIGKEKIITNKFEYDSEQITAGNLSPFYYKSKADGDSEYKISQGDGKNIYKLPLNKIDWIYKSNNDKSNLDFNYVTIKGRDMYNSSLDIMLYYNNQDIDKAISLLKRAATLAGSKIK